MDQPIDVDVVARRELVPGSVVELTLARTDSTDLPQWQPGAHLDLILPSGLSRPYSLCSDPADLSSYRIAVLLEPESRGGSTEIHERIHVGEHLAIRGPRNHFHLEAGPYTILIAGGIGITPILAMARRLADDGAGFEIHYGGRSRGAMAYVEELLTTHPSLTRVYDQEIDGLLPLVEIVKASPDGAAIHACGPTPMLEAVERAVASRSDLRLRFERFGPSSGPEAAATADTAFTVELRRSGRTLPVPTDTRLIDVVRQVVPSVPFSCEEGYCGSCETGVIDGEPDHRDTVLTEEERASNTTMMICVGRSCSSVLVLDI